MDFSRGSTLGVCMDENRDELIALLGARIGMVMEDVADVALTVGAAAPEQRNGQIEMIVRAVGELSSLASALETLRE